MTRTVAERFADRVPPDTSQVPKKNCKILISLTQDQYDAIATAARQEGLPRPSAYIHQLLGSTYRQHFVAPEDRQERTVEWHRQNFWRLVEEAIARFERRSEEHLAEDMRALTRIPPERLPKVRYALLGRFLADALWRGQPLEVACAYIREELARS